MTEEELMALYAIARDELDGVKKACESLEKSVRRLENTGNNIESNAEDGVRIVLRSFNDEVGRRLEKHVSEASMGLKRAVEDAKRELRYVYWYKLVWSFIFGLMLAVGGLGWFTWRNLNDFRTGQNVLYEEIQILKSRTKAQKPKVKHKKAEQTQGVEAASEES